MGHFDNYSCFLLCFYLKVIIMKYFLACLAVYLCCAMVSAQESINVHAGVNIGMHAGIAVLISFSILATCTGIVNLIHYKSKSAAFLCSVLRCGVSTSLDHSCSY